MKSFVLLLLAFPLCAAEFPNPIRAGGVVIYNPTSQDYERHGTITTNYTPAQVVTSAAPASVIAKAQQLGRILTNFAAVTSQTGVNYDALKEYALNNAADLTIAQQTMLATCDRLWAEVREYAPNGLLNFSPTTVTTNPARAEVEWTPKQ